MGSHGGEDEEDGEAGVEVVEEICVEGIGYRDIVQLQLDTWIYRSPDIDLMLLFLPHQEIVEISIWYCT